MSDITHENPVSDHVGGEQGDHTKPRYDDVNIPVMVMLGLFSTIMTFVIICFLQGLYYQWHQLKVLRDWNERSLTPQEVTIVEQKAIRDGFYETDDGGVYISVDAAGQKLINNGGDLSLIEKPRDEVETPKEPPSAAPEKKADAPKVEKPKAESTKKITRPEPPGPGPEKEEAEASAANEGESKSPAKAKSPENADQKADK